MACKPPVEYANPRSIAELAEPLRSRIQQAVNDAPGRNLFLVSGKRTDWQQWLLRHERCPGNECNMAACKGSPVTAVPGRSNHRNISSTICAADMGGLGLDWLIANRESYGLALTVSSEKWHFEPNKRDVRTGRVHDKPTRKITPFGQKPQPAPGKWHTIHPGDTDAKLKAMGGLGNEIAELQLRLIKRKLYDGKVDGVYGPKTQEGVVKFKKFIIAIQKLTGQPVWTNTDKAVGVKTRDMLRFWTA
jgi:hypothetical protein